MERRWRRGDRSRSRFNRQRRQPRRWVSVLRSSPRALSAQRDASPVALQERGHDSEWLLQGLMRRHVPCWPTEFRLALLLDTGIIVALLNREDRWHLRCREMIETNAEELVVPQPALIEVDYFMKRDLPPAAWRAFYEDVAAGRYRIELFTAVDLVRTLDIVVSLGNANVQIVDASLIAMCERLDETKIATIDRRDFRRVVPLHCAALDLLPDGPDWV